MGEEVAKKRIEDDEFTLFYDYDELRDGRLHKLSPRGSRKGITSKAFE